MKAQAHLGACRTAIILLAMLLSACQSAETSTGFKYKNGTKKAHHTNDGFKNLYVEDNDKNFFDFLEMRFLGDEEWADHASLTEQVPIQAVDVQRLMAKSKMLSENGNPLVTWLGHSMFLVQHNSLTLLTDPIFSDRASPLSFAGPKRYVKHAMDYNQLPDIDIVVISHNHYDHLDNDSIAKLAKRSNAQVSRTQFFVPLGLKAHLIDEGVNAADITEMDWWSKTVVTNGLSSAQIQALPSQHWSARGLSDRLQTLWASWAVDFGDFTVWFAGDTGYNDVQFKQIGNALERVDLALIPIGAYEPRWFMKKYHVNPAEALKIHHDVKATKSIGMHWGTFPMTAEEPGEPLQALAKEKTINNVDNERFITLAIGESITLK